MPELYHQFSQLLHQHYQPEHKIVIAFSGGIDSRVLLDLAHQYQRQHPVNIMAIYVHHGLSSNADEWAENCARWAAQAGIAFKVEYVQLASASGESIEKLAREARYQALEKHLNQGDLLLTGQHADDQLETFLLALKRGSGPKGLSSMAESMPFAGGKVVRPLLKCSRAQIEAYAESRNLAWVEDESNQDTRFDRNFIRHQVTPVLTERWPFYRQSVQRSAELCAEQEALLNELLAEKFQSALQSDGSLSIAVLADSSELARVRLLRMWFEHHHQLMPSREHSLMIWQQIALAKQDANPQLNLQPVQIRRFNGALHMLVQWADVSQWRSVFKLGETLNLPDSLGCLSLQDSGAQNHLRLPEGKATCFDVVFEPQGLSAHPVGRGHSRKLKKLFQEYDVPSWQRRRTPILLHQGRVVAVAGLFIDQAFAGHDCELLWSK